jgi:hypothetical protein
MALPTKDNTIHLPYQSAWHRQINEWMAWYSADSNSILNFYDTAAGGFWVNGDGELSFSERKRRDWIHMPIAADIAAISASLLFSEAPKIALPDGEAKDRWDDFYRQSNFPSKLLEAAEIAAAGGGVYLKLSTDPSSGSLPNLDIIQPSDVQGRFRNGRLVGYVQTSVVRVEDNGSVVYRLIESRDPLPNGGAMVEIGVFKGDRTTLGRQIDPSELPETAHFSQNTSTMTAAGSGIGVVYVPNVLPNRINPSIREGISDLHGLISLLDALDSAYTAWMKDIELGRGRAFVDKEILSGDTMDVNQDYFIKVSMDETKFGGAHGYKPFEVFQFDLRTEEHKATCLHLIEQIVDRAGYSPASFGFGLEGRAESGTALRMRERKSMLTRNKKSRYWSARIKDLFRQVGEFDAALLSGVAADSWDITVTLGDSVVPEESERAQTVQMLSAASAISLKRKVEMVNPDWGDEQVEAEVALIQAEQGLALEPFEAEPVAMEEDES